MSEKGNEKKLFELSQLKQQEKSSNVEVEDVTEYITGMEGPTPPYQQGAAMNKRTNDDLIDKFIRNNMVLFNLMKLGAKKTFRDSTMHGLSNACRTENLCVRIFWTILALTSGAFAIFFCYTSSKSYFQYDVSVTIEPVDETPVTFPAVTMCNLNPFDADSANYLRETLPKYQLNPMITPTDDEPAIHLVKDNMNLLKAVSASLLSTNQSFVKGLGFSLDTMLISCYFNGQKCNSSDFTWWFSYDYGNCYTFNAGNSSLKETSKAGPQNGLSMEIFVGSLGPSQELFMERRGAFIGVHNNSQYLLTRYDGIRVPPGYASDIGFSRTYYSKLPKPYSDCVSSDSESVSTYFEYATSISDYSRKLCIEICLQFEYIVPSCYCSDPSVPYVSLVENQMICSNLTQLDCVSSIRDVFDTKSTNCDEYCPVECEKFTYSYSMAMTKYPTQYYYNVIDDQPNVIKVFNESNIQLTRDNFDDSMLYVNVFYTDLVYSAISESPSLTFSDVIGIVGGQLGLFLGMSLMTFFEVFEFIIELVDNFITSQISSRRVKPGDVKKTSDFVHRF